MPNKKILKTLIEQNQQEKANQEVEQFLATYIRKSKIQGIDTTTKEFQEKLETMKAKMLGIKPKKEQREGVGGLRGLVEDFDNLQELQEKITTELDNLETIKSTLGNELRSVKIKVNEIENKQTDWEEIINKPEIILQDEFIQEQIKTEEKTKTNFKLILVIKDEIQNAVQGLRDLISGVSKEIAQLRAKKTNHSELLGITKDQHHKERHTLESHLITDFFSKLKRLISGDYVDDLHKHKQTAREQIKEWYGGGFRGVNTNQITVSATEPTSPELNDLWINTS